MKMKKLMEYTNGAYGLTLEKVESNYYISIKCPGSRTSIKVDAETIRNMARWVEHEERLRKLLLEHEEKLAD